MPRPKYRFSSRHTRTARMGIKKEKSTFPELLKDTIENSDILLQILDARFINETRNHEVEKFIKSKNKKLIFILNKADLTSSIENKPSPYIIFSAKERQGKSKLLEKIKIESKKIRDKLIVTIGVIGFPNTGKSSIINLLRGKKSARTSSSSGYTKGIQKLKLTENIRLIDTPGVIPRSEYSTTNKSALVKHTKIAARDYSKAKDPEMVIHIIMQEYPGIIEKHYNIKAEGDSELLIEKLGRKNNFIKKGNQVDLDRTARLILKEWQEGKIKIK